MLVALKGEYIAIREMRRHAAWYTKGLPYAAELRLKLNQAESREDFLNCLSEQAG
jgi:tRNA-dihydrouridine synthase B